MAAPPTSAAPQDHDRRPSTALPAVFRRLGGKTLASATARVAPQLLGFAELVAEVPPVEDFLSADEKVATLGAEEPIESAVVAGAPLQVEPEPAPPIDTRPREAPPNPSPPARPQNPVGRLDRRPGDAPASPTMPTSEAGVTSAPAARASPTTTARRHPVESPPAPFQQRSRCRSVDVA